MLDSARQTQIPLNLVRAWYDSCDPSLLSSGFTCTAIGYGTRRSVYVGAEGMLETFFGEIGEAYDKWSLSVDRMIDADQSITVLGRYAAIPKGGELVELPFVHVWDVADELICAVTCFTDASETAL